jgi:hypothetical protein
MTEQQQHPSSSSNVSLLDTFPEGQYLFETWLADAVQAYRRASCDPRQGAEDRAWDLHKTFPRRRERFLAQLVADKAARWAWDQREPEIRAAADAELEACCEWLADARNHRIGNDFGKIISTEIRAARRPKPPSLKAQALEALKAHFDAMEAGVSGYRPAHKATIRRALEALPDG